MSQEFQRDYLVRLPLPLAQLYSRAYNAKDARGRHDNTFYLFEALIKLAAAPAVAAYLHEVEQGGPRVAALDRLLAHLALPSLGQWVAMLRELARHFGARPDAAAHPLGHLWDQLNRPASRPARACWPSTAGSRTAPTASRPATRAARCCRCSTPWCSTATASSATAAGRFESFYEQEMGPLLFPAANEMLAEGMLDVLGPRGSRLVYLTELRMLDEGSVEVGLRELVGLQGERARRR